MIKVFLKKKISNRVLVGHPWIYDNEIEKIDGNANGGEIVLVFTYDKKFIGQGYINPKSQIVVRILTRKKEEVIDDDFFYKRIAQCWEYRKKLGYTENCRLVF